MTDEPIGGLRKPAARGGVFHALAAAACSFAGFKRLLREAAFRQELLLAAIVFGVFALLGAPAQSFGIQAVLFLVLVAVEALNTAVEVLVDRISPGFAVFAAQAKDLGSFAVFCLLCANGGFALLVFWQCLG